MERARPSGLLVIAIVGIVLGSLGVCAGSMGAIGTLAQERLQAMQEGFAATPEMAEMQRAMNEPIEAVTRKWLPFTVTQAVVNLLASLALVVASILLLRYHPRAPALFVGAAIASAIADASGAVLGTLVQFDMQGALREMTAHMPGPGPDRLFEGMIQGSVAFALCFSAGWALVKIATYVASIVYLRKPHVRALFGAPGA